MPPPSPADRAVLLGHRIALDPGHGGAFPGAIGRRGLRESDINLDIARLLAGRLSEAGAEVLLTRDSDSDFVARDSTRLHDDLEARVQKTNAFLPEVFLSIHHNAEASGDSSHNGLETYYRMSDPGPSQDAAVRIHQTLAAAEAAPHADLIPGNYYVLRRSSASASVLGEASYLSNPANEELLMTPQRRVLEAEGYYQGLLEYFRAGVPHLIAMGQEGATYASLPSGVTAEIADGPGGQQLDPNSVLVLLDGQPVKDKVVERVSLAARSDTTDTARVQPGLVRVSLPLPATLSNGPHFWTAQARNLNGNSLPAEVRDFTLSEPPAQLTVRTVPPSIRRLGRFGGDMFEVIVDGVDLRGQPVEGARGTLALSNGWFALPNGDFTRDSIPFNLKGGAYHAIVRLSSKSSRDIDITARLGGRSATYEDPQGPPSARWLLVRAKTLRGSTTVALPGATVLWDGRVMGRTDEAGFLGMRLDARPGGLDSVTVVMPGYLKRTYLVQTTLDDYSVDLGSGYVSTGTWPYFSFEDAVLPPIPDAAVWKGLRVAIDPVGSANQPGRVMGSEMGALFGGPDVDLQVARILQGFLETAGAEVMVTHTAEDAPTQVARLRSIEQFRAQRVLLIAHAPSAAGFYFNPGSQSGEQWARAQANVWGDVVGGRRPDVGQDARYLLRQSSGAALLAQLGPGPDLSSPPEANAARARAEAVALYEGLLAAQAEPRATELGGLRFTFGRPWARQLLQLDGNLLIGLDREGHATLPAAGPGAHRIDAQLEGDGLWAMVQVDSGEVRRISDTNLKPYNMRPSPSAGLPDVVFHQRYPEELSPTFHAGRPPSEAVRER